MARKKSEGVRRFYGIVSYAGEALLPKIVVSPKLADPGRGIPESV